MENKEQQQDQKIISEQTQKQLIKKQRPRWIVPVIIIAGIIILGIGVWFEYNYWLKSAVPEEQSVEEQQEEVDEFTDWKTYRNEKYGFELKYPVIEKEQIVEEKDSFEQNMVYFKYWSENYKDYTGGRNQYVTIKTGMTHNMNIQR